MHILHEVIGPPRIKIEKTSRTVAKLLVGPLPSGFGVTIGNALRRVMFSSLPGAAVTGMKISGVTHEYTTVPGIKESVLDITLNLRALRLKKHSKGVEEVEIPVKKSGVITAQDLKISSDIEILDPEQVIATCDGADSKLKFVVRIEKGVGFKIISNENSFSEEDPEYILIDANFSPITQVKYTIDPARVGEQTNLDQLILDVETNGSIEAENAIKLAAGILKSYFFLFEEEDAYTDEDFTTTFSALKKKEEARVEAEAEAENSFVPIDILGLSQRTLNALVNGGITSVEQLQKTPMTQLSQLRGFGQKARTELEQVLAERGYQLPAAGNMLQEVVAPVEEADQTVAE